MACDVCGKTGVDLEQFREPYQTKDIKEACPDCVKKIDDHILKIRRMNDNIEKLFTKQFIENLRVKLFKK